MRAPVWVEEAIRETSRESGTPLVDLRSLFDRAGPLGLAGDELIFGNVHPNLAGHEAIAGAVLGVLEREIGVPFDRSLDVPSKEGRRLLGIDDYAARAARQAEALDLAQLSGLVNEGWHAARAACEGVLAADAAAWEVSGAMGLLDAIAGHADRARVRIEGAMRQNPYVKLSYLFFWKTEAPYRRALDAAGVDMAAVEAALAPSERGSLENRLYRARTR